MLSFQRNIFQKYLPSFSHYSFSTKQSKPKTLFDQYKLGNLTLPNRIVMAPLTRCRADYQTAIPNDLHIKYYSERAKAGLIVTECSSVSAQGQAFNGAAGIWTTAQSEGWKKVTDAVHNEGGRIFLQIWHGGRACHKKITGLDVFGPSAIPISGDPGNGQLVYDLPKEMTDYDIKQVINAFYQGAKRAKVAGFDGLELHGANGYLVDTFLRDGSNKRTDNWGGSISNRCRLALEIMEILADVFGPERVGIRLSPVSSFQSMHDSNPIELYSYLLHELSDIGIAYVHFIEPDTDEEGGAVGRKQIPNVAKQFRKEFNGTMISCNNLNPKTALEKIQKGECDLAAFGRYFIANPDLVDRIKNDWPLNNKWDHATFYSQGEVGYTDYPTYDAKKK